MPFKRNSRLAAPLSRRGFMKGFAATAAGLYIPKTFANIPNEKERQVALHNLHTGEKVKLKVVYCLACAALPVGDREVHGKNISHT